MRGSYLFPASDSHRWRVVGVDTKSLAPGAGVAPRLLSHVGTAVLFKVFTLCNWWQEGSLLLNWLIPA